MFTKYTPGRALSLFAVAALSWIIAIVAWLYWNVASVAWVMVLFGIGSAYIGGFTIAVINWQEKRDTIDSDVRLADSISRMDSGARELFAQTRALTYVPDMDDDSSMFAVYGVSRDKVRLFMHDCQQYAHAHPGYIVPKRDWRDTDRPPTAWQNIYDCLLEHNMVGTETRGPNTYAWAGGAYDWMLENYPPRGLAAEAPVNLNTAPGRTYAATDE